MKYASLCLLAYKRPQQFTACIESLIKNTDFPYELIVNLDGDNPEHFRDVTHRILSEYSLHKISKLIYSGGENRGVGRSFQNCLGMVEGDYIFKIDTDLTFKPGWLSKSVGILDNNPDVGAVSLFDYHDYDPNDERFKPAVCHKEFRNDCIIVEDFVSSIYGFRKEDLPKIVPVEDDGNHSKLQKLAITKESYVHNSGFGVTKSTYVSGTEDHPYKTPTFDKPLIFKSTD